MFLPPSQLEWVLTKRLEQLQGLPNPVLGQAHCLASTLQAHTSAAGLEWSSTDGHDEAQPENIQVDLSNAALSAQLDAWEAWLGAGGVVAKAQYLAATHALVKDVLGCIIVGSDPAVSRTALDAAWEEDAGVGSGTLPADRFKSSLAALATSCSSDGAPQTAADCLASLLAKSQEQQQRWQGLVEQYATAAGQSAPEAAVAAAAAAAATVTEAAAGGDAAATEAEAAGATVAAVEVGTAAAGGDAAAAAAGNGEASGDLDELLGEDNGDARDVDRSPEVAATASAGGGGQEDGGAEAAADNDDDDDAFSLGLSRPASHTSTAPSATSEAAAAAGVSVDAAAADDGDAAPRGAARRGLSVKSIEDPELRRALSGASSADLDEMPPDDLDAAPQRQGSNAIAASGHGRPKAASAAAVSAEGGKGHLADLDLKAWAALKDKQQQQLPPAPGAQPRGRAAPGPALAPLASRGDAGKQVLDQHLKGARGPPMPAPASNPLHSTLSAPASNPLHGAIFSGNAVRQSMERQSMERGAAAGGAAAGGLRGNGVSRHGSNGSDESPARVRKLVANLSRKLSISEPGPMGQQAEWKHLPALGQASRLHPHEMRQPSYGTLRTGGGGGQSRGRADAAALIEDKLPALPSLAGARGQPPKAMELLRRPSVIQRSDAHHAGDSYHPSAPNALLPGLGPNSKQGPQGARALCVQAKKSFRGDRNF